MTGTTATADAGEMLADMFKQATESFHQSMNMGTTFQEENVRFWSDTFGKSFDEMRSHFEKMSSDAVPTAKKNLDRFHQIFDDQTKRSMDTLRQTFNRGQKFTADDMFQQTLDLWKSSFDAMRSTVDVMSKTNVNLLESWAQMMRQTESRTTKGNGKPSSK